MGRLEGALLCLRSRDHSQVKETGRVNISMRNTDRRNTSGKSKYQNQKKMTKDDEEYQLK